MPHKIPETGLLRLPQIIGNKTSNPPIPALIPVCESTWWQGVKNGRYPQPIRDKGCTFWRVEDILDYIEEVGKQK